MELCVRKSGPGAVAEGDRCRLLEPVTPRVYAISSDAYYMEFLEPARRDPALLVEMENLLDRIWSTPVTLQESDRTWPVFLTNRVGIRVPEFVLDGRPCLTHGDCTVANAMRRDSGELVIADPRTPRPYVARHAETDMGRLLQSALGWEVVTHGEELVLWDEPKFWSDPVASRRAVFWCGVTAQRIYLDWRTRCPENLTPEIVNWLHATREYCYDTIGL